MLLQSFQYIMILLLSMWTVTREAIAVNNLHDPTKFKQWEQNLALALAHTHIGQIILGSFYCLHVWN